MQHGSKTSRPLIAMMGDIKPPRDYPWKVLGALKADLGEFISDSEREILSGIIRTRDVGRLLSLADEWGLQSITPALGLAPTQLFARYQLSNALKKYLFVGSEAERRATALKKFQQCEHDCRLYNRVGHLGLLWGDGSSLTNIFTYARCFVRKVLGGSLPDADKLTERSRHGPGANLDTKHGQTDLYSKYRNWPYSCSETALGEARDLIQSDARWLGALEDSYRTRNNIPKTVIIDRATFWQNVFTVKNHNRVTFVPKNARTDRSIAIEPAMNLMLQLGVDGYIRKRLKPFGVDLDCQLKNQRLARIGSVSPERFVTLDLAGASDSVSISLARSLLPPDWFNYLMKIRVPFGDVDGKVFKYEKISSMGNGYTFALESLIFTSIIYGVMRESWGKFDRNSFAVFGDDLIVPAQLAELTVDALSAFGFSLNHDKSFFTGYVRESCGADWFQGHSIRPVFLSSMPTNVQHLYNDLNRLKRMLSIRCGISSSETERVILQWIPEFFRTIVGPCSDTEFDTFIHVSFPSKGQRGWVWKFRRLIVVGVKIRAPDFLFRKLMASLRTNDLPLYPWNSRYAGGVRLTSGGSCFDVRSVNSLHASLITSETSHWSPEYTDLLVN